MPRAGCGLCLPALAQELAELVDRLVLIGSEILGDDQLRVGPVRPDVFIAVACGTRSG